jgi:glycosyltransferase involved in cell wall biosynthesis
MRYALTIVYNAKHHLLHKDFAERMVSMFDKWVIVEGFSRNGGSTAWCTSIRPPAQSTDGTIQTCQDLASQYPTKVLFATSLTGWPSKDAQVNKGIELLQGNPDGWLWQVDADEHWTESDLAEAETMLGSGSNTAGGFQFYHYLCKDSDGRQLVGKGSWGDGISTRLWWWHGQKFKTHEPPIMEGQDGYKVLPQKYHHYSYYFEQDVEFKSRYYKGYRSVLANWRTLQKRRFDYPISAKLLLGSGTSVDLTNSYITTLS